MFRNLSVQASILLEGLFWLTACSCTRTDESAGCIEKIDPACICTMDYNPVCGCNQKTYSNSCMAECAGIKEYTPGPCKK